MNMKIGFIIAALIMCFSAASIAQTTTTSIGNTPVSFGLRAGVNFQNLNGKNASGGNLDNKMKVGFNAGVTADIPVAAPDYFVQTGLLFTTKGAKVEPGVGPANKVNLNYIEIPITFLYKPGTV